jgi:hypothetical protein
MTGPEAERREGILQIKDLEITAPLPVDKSIRSVGKGDGASRADAGIALHKFILASDP